MCVCVFFHLPVGYLLIQHSGEPGSASHIADSFEDSTVQWPARGLRWSRELVRMELPDLLPGFTQIVYTAQQNLACCDCQRTFNQTTTHILNIERLFNFHFPRNLQRNMNDSLKFSPKFYELLKNMQLLNLERGKRRVNAVLIE